MALLRRAIELHGAGKSAEAERTYRAALALDGGNVDAQRNYGVLLHSLGRFAEAEQQARRALALKPDDAEAQLNLALAMRKLGRPQDALEAVRRSLALRPNSATAELTLGNALQDLDQNEAAEAALHRALALQPDFAIALNNLGNAHIRRGAVDEAVAYYRRAVEVDPLYTEAHYSLGLALLLQGELAEGLEEYEWRWQRGGLKPHRFRAPLWTTDAPSAATVLVYSEQGIGDIIQFARYVPLLTARGHRVLFGVPPALERLFAHLGGATIVPPGKALPSFDRQIALLSLPRALGTRIETIPADVPYLAAPPKVVSHWRTRLGGDGGVKVGLVWRGSTTFATDRKRSIDPSLLGPLFGVPGVRLISLQKEPRDHDLAVLRGFGPLEHIGAELGDFADTAGALLALDLVVSVDTAVAHLAGALGHPVLLLLPFAPDWRWLLARDDSPWYPSARLFRQPALDDWPSVIARVATALRESATAQLR